VSGNVCRDQEEGGYEYASYNKGAENGKQEAHVEPAILVQPRHEAGEGALKALVKKALGASSLSHAQA
jgi:hypothetical protein